MSLAQHFYIRHHWHFPESILSSIPISYKQDKSFSIFNLVIFQFNLVILKKMTKLKPFMTKLKLYISLIFLKNRLTLVLC